MSNLLWKYRTTPPPPPPPPAPDTPSLVRWVVGYLMVGMAWGLTTPFIRKGAVEMQAPHRPELSATPWLQRQILSLVYTAADLLRNPRYSVPLLLNLSGSVWFFVLIGTAELSLTVPITNSLAFLFTVLGEWWAEGKVISRDTWLGMACVLSGIALCVHSKNT